MTKTATIIRLFFIFTMANPESSPRAAETVPAAEAAPKMNEVLKRQDAIKDYFKMAYGEVCFDPEKAAKKAGFENRKQADAYLSTLTGSTYGPQLKSGDRISSPDGEEMEYIATAQETLAIIQEGPDFYFKEREIAKYTAFAYAERMHYPLEFASDVSFHSPDAFYGEIVQLRVLELKEGASAKGSSGREYRKKGNSIYFNGTPDKDKVWGSLDGGDAYFIEDRGSFVPVEQHENVYDETTSADVILFSSEGQKKVYDKIGNYSERWTKEWTW